MAGTPSPKGNKLGFAVAGLPVFDLGIPHDFAEYAVIAALHDDVPVFAGKRARDAQCGHDGFRTGIREPDQFGGGHHLADAAGNFVFEFRRQRKYAADVHAFPCRFVDARIAVAEDDRPIGEAVVDVLVVIDIPDASTLCRASRRWFRHRPSNGSSKKRPAVAC